MSIFARLSGSFLLKLLLVLLLLLLAVGAVGLVLVLRTSEMHAQEIRQRLNREVADHIAKDLRPFIGAEADKEALKPLFMDVMKISPALEVYLLDAEGRILAYDAPPERVVRERVSLDPVRRFLDQQTQGLVRGDDPRDPQRQKAFTVARLEEDGALRGYLYIILGGEEYDSVVSRLAGSYILRISFLIGAAVLVVAALAGLAAFGFLTRPLRRLRQAMQAFQAQPGSARLEIRSRDEFGTLAASFNQMADRIVRQIRRVKEADELRRELVTNISHDLRTPISAVQGCLETILLKDDDLSASDRQVYLNTALRNTARLSALVKDLFELARLDSGDVQLQVEPFLLQELAQDLVQKFKVQAQEHGVRLLLRCPERLPRVTGDIGLIERAIDNLVQNAIRYTPEGGTVAVSLLERGREVEIRVTDTGPGIPSKDLPRIFDRFYRVEKSRSEDLGGTGLGLAIVKRILDLHRRSISVRSRPQAGTSFSFSLAA